METAIATRELSFEERIEQTDGLTFEECVEKAQSLRDLSNKCQWALGALADRVNRTWGERAMQSFASKVGFSLSYAYQLANCYAAFPNFSTRVENFSFSHHRIACLLSDEPGTVLREADLKWSVRELENWLNDKNDKNGKATAPPRNHNTLLDDESQNRIAEVRKLQPNKTTNQIINESLKRIVPNQVTVVVESDLENDYRFLSEYLADGSPQDVFTFAVHLAANLVREKHLDSA